MSMYKITNKWGLIKFVVTDCWFNIFRLTDWCDADIESIENLGSCNGR